MANLKEAQAKIRAWKASPVKFVYDNFNVTPDAWQMEFLEALADPKIQRIAMKASKGPGKTASLTWALWWFFVVHGEPGHHPKGAITSISKDNLKDNAWRELAKWRNYSPFIKGTFEWTKERIYAKDHPETWGFTARAWPKSGDLSQQANTMAGGHEKYIINVFDEAGGIPQSVMTTAEGVLANPGGVKKILIAGNPTHLEGPLYSACTSQRHLWKVITVNGDPDNPNRSKRVSMEWAKEQIEQYGRDNPWVLVNVFGEFPPSSLNTLLGPEEVEKAMRTTYNESEYAHSQRRLGIDVARFGDDRTVIMPRQGLVAHQPVEMRGANTNGIAARVMLAKERWKSELEIIDDTGHWGHGVIDNLTTAGFDPIGVQFHGQAIDKRYKNRRAEGWLKMADWIKSGGALPNIPSLVAELTTPTYTFTNGKFQLEEKDQIKSRLGRSPDIADALAITFMVPEMPASNPQYEHLFNKRAKLKSEYDPFRP